MKIETYMQASWRLDWFGQTINGACRVTTRRDETEKDADGEEMAQTRLFSAHQLTCDWLDTSGYLLFVDAHDGWLFSVDLASIGLVVSRWPKTVIVCDNFGGRIGDIGQRFKVDFAKVFHDCWGESDQQLKYEKYTKCFEAALMTVVVVAVQTVEHTDTGTPKRLVDDD